MPGTVPVLPVAYEASSSITHALQRRKLRLSHLTKGVLLASGGAKI